MARIGTDRRSVDLNPSLNVGTSFPQSRFHRTFLHAGAHFLETTIESELDSADLETCTEDWDGSFSPITSSTNMPLSYSESYSWRPMSRYISSGSTNYFDIEDDDSVQGRDEMPYLTRCHRYLARKMKGVRMEGDLDPHLRFRTDHTTINATHSYGKPCRCLSEQTCTVRASCTGRHFCPTCNKVSHCASVY